MNEESKQVEKNFNEKVLHFFMHTFLYLGIVPFCVWDENLNSCFGVCWIYSKVGGEICLHL